MKFNLPDFRLACVLVVGDVMLDRYWYGQNIIISSEALVPVIKVDSIDERPGGAANVAMNIAALGASARLIGLTGIDDAASTLNTRLRDVDVICDFVTLANYPTTVKLRVISRNKQLIRLDLESIVGDFDASTLLERIKLALPAASILVISDYAKGTLKHVREIIMQAKDAGVKVLVDPKGTDFSRYCGATLLTPNLSEFEGVSGGPCKDEMTLVRRGMKIIDDYNLSALLITRSEQGMTLLQQGKDPLYFPPNAKKVSDVTGAGDTVIGVLAVSLAAGNSIEDACFLANIAAGIVVGKLCTATISVAELENEILGSAEIKFGVMTENELKQAVALARNRGEKLVMTNGIFDILHSGHVNYLAQARKLGDRLIVAVNSDDSTKRIKDKSRPVNSLSQRMNVLSALKAVDWVVSFSEDTPQRLIADILPDVLVKGGDYQPNKIAGSKEVWAHGGDVQVLNFEESCSTTNIINVIKDNARS